MQRNDKLFRTNLPTLFGSLMLNEITVDEYVTRVLELAQQCGIDVIP